MSGDREHELYKRGEHLAAELHRFLEREVGSDAEDVAHALRGAYDYLDVRTRLIRGESPWPSDDPQSRRPSTS